MLIIFQSSQVQQHTQTHTPAHDFHCVYMIGYIFSYMVYSHGHGIWLLGDYGSIWLYNISLTHIRP